MLIVACVKIGGIPLRQKLSAQWFVGGFLTMFYSLLDLVQKFSSHFICLPNFLLI